MRVHKDFLSSEPNLLWSRICQSWLSKEWLDGSSDDRVIDLDGVPASEFRALLEHFYYEYVLAFNGFQYYILIRLWIQAHPRSGG